MKYLLTLIISIVVLNCFGQTGGTLSFTVKTVSYSAPYSPKHILAIWIATGSGTWVKTRKFMSQSTLYRQYLTNFKNATSNTYNSTDAITGATLQSHVTHTVTWDGKNSSGTLVADGTYRVYIEYTSANATGKLYYVEFTKGPDTLILTPANQTYFQNISLTWAPSTIDVETTESEPDLVTCYPNPFSGSMQISLSNNSGQVSSIDVYDISGKPVRSFSNFATGENRITWNGKNNSGSDLPSGIYFISVQKGTGKKVIKVIKR